MRKIKCELCVQRDLLKEGSRFVCQTCGAAYSADQLRRQFDLADQAEIYAEAKQAYRAKRFKQARQLYLALAEEGDQQAAFYASLSSSQLGPAADFAPLLNQLRSALAASRDLGEVIVFALAVEEECEEDFQKQAQRLELNSRQTLEKAHQKMQKEAGRDWLLMSQAAHLCVGESDDLAAVSPYFWELVDAIIDDLSINQKRGTIALGNVKEERDYFEALKAEKKAKKLVNG
ncbi:hypothetical protein LDE05_06990 [Lactobacillus delbrueckii subsp. bulgaricus]|uniref:Uncharacterized protein n=1 Tax=Lactobacillus delbrueckii subsp. bulgaricus (strain ATCC 11842 / DSM 20081 / BCRC 10696 / JCM 1002 / NBRC 13953 / NCIMB 11778 / NCTC 12712 / WDCM 00102 / Lb 14) TaxID=390333 RepID=Q1G9V7_LACDA|nr:hypothetical protein [Lactobacillus delbrueckii]KRN38401.1 hypothetical protein IV47_GL001614 [Lactobacillus delbrueckii subsp. bulgaricus ATCC 11842 = JCM 1002]MDG9748887.1 hypothetical protein [Lactobacillus delbrueckii subsp. bulgaricus ATCC 11842 = JCM 1002]QIE61831.1 hypothetical protein G5B51_05520 [Lactobacillus delbrueckii subsp. bulgaricus]CAI98067.1 Hypothetical protein Ldb1266 [Lactobacillus delbrueckii subsp. bulgaricus ATCC 11842 = JCM 1002]GEB90836.1 hypothetical protein LDE05